MNNEYIRLSKVPKYLQKTTGETRSRMTVYNWALYGRKNYGGSKVVKLKAKKHYGYWVTTTQWVDEFLTELEDF